MKISEIFNLNKSQFELDFVDIDPEVDTPLFLDPYFISKSDTEFGRAAYILLNDFFSTLLSSLNNGNIALAQELFSYLGENNELCLGLSRGTPSGKGMGPKDSERIFKELLNSKALHSGLLSDIEDFRLFVRNVDRDKISDMTGNIIKSLLLQYTQDQCELLGIPLIDGVPTGYYWDLNTHSWENRYGKSLICYDRKILLVPKRFVSYSNEYCSEKYLRNFALNFLQNEHLRLNTHLVENRKDGRPFVTKKSIEEEEHISDKKDWLVDFTSRHREVFADFKENAIKAMKPVSNEELTDIKLSDICLYLSNALEGLPTGGNYASTYQHIVLGVLELLLYPDITYPKLEHKIHDGRKRIDITFDNCAETGFFYRLKTTYGISAPIIMIECKNYSNDIQNPEIDQLIGRFSPRRGMFGISTSRKFENKQLILKRCQDTYMDSGNVIFPIEDADFITLLKTYPVEGRTCVERFLQELFRTIVIN